MENGRGALMFARYFSLEPRSAAASRLETVARRSWVRRLHRGLALLFTLTVIANFAAMAFGKPPAWIVYSPLPPLFLLMFSGLTMLAGPLFRARL
jgi:hypothetical protein